MKTKKIVAKFKFFAIMYLLITLAIPQAIFAVDYSQDYVDPKAADASVININDLEKSTNNLAMLSSINSQVLGIDAYDQKQYEDWLKIGQALLASKAENGALWQKYQANGEELSPEITEEIGVNWDTFSKFDIRMIESLNYLVGPKQNGGAGREWLAIPNITKGYNVLASAAASGIGAAAGISAQIAKDSTAKEADEESIGNDKDALNHISAHSSEWGQAVDISQIDFLRGTVLAYDKEDKLVGKAKMSKIPIDVSWQTDYRPSQEAFPDAPGRDWLPNGFSDFGRANANSAFNNLANMLANEATINCQPPTNNPKVSGDNLAQMVIVNLGLVCYLQEQELPINFTPGYDLEQSAIKLGQIITQNLSGGNIPASGLAGNNLKELEINLGKEWTGQSLGLPVNTLQTINSHDLIIAVGKNVLAEKLNMLPGSLNNLSEGNTAMVIGQGYIEKILNLPPGAMNKAILSEVKFAIGEEKANYIFGKPAMIDKILGIGNGETGQFLSGARSPGDFSRTVGQAQINKINSAYPKAELQDSAFGVSVGDIGVNQFANDLEKQKQWYLENYNFSDVVVPDKNVKARDYFSNNFAGEFYNNSTNLNNFLAQYATAKNNNLMARFFSGDKQVFYDMGLRILSRIFSEDPQMWPFYEQWLKQENDPSINTISDIKKITLPDRTDLPVVDAYYLNSQFGFSAGDLERIFILDRAQEVFQRLGNVKLIGSFTQKTTTPSSILAENPQSEIDVFSPYYQEKFSEVSEEAKKISSPQVKSEAEQIANLANEAINYQEPAPQDIEKLTRITKYNEITDLMQKLLVDMAKKNPAGVDLEPLRKNINDIIAGQDITNPLSFSKDQIKENYSDYYMVSGEFKNNIYQVVNGNKTANNMAKEIGLIALANQVLEHPDQSILISANDRVKQNYQSTNSTLMSSIASSGISGEKFAQDAAQIANSGFSLSGDSLITGNDIINFLNGAYISLAQKIGSNTANQAFAGGNFKGYIEGNVSADTLRQQVNNENYSQETLNTIFDYIVDDANVFDIGMNLFKKNSSLDISGFYKGTNSNWQENIRSFTNSFFTTGKVSDEEIQQTSSSITNYLIFGNFRGFSNINQALSTSRMYKNLYPEAGFRISDFLPKSVINVVKDHRDDVNFVLNLSKPGFLTNYLNSNNLKNMAEKLYSKALAEKLGDDNLAYGALNDLFSNLSNPNFSQDQAINAFRGYLNQPGFLNNIPENIRPLFTTALNSDQFDAQTVSTMLTGLVNNDKGLNDKEKNQLTSALSFAMNKDYSFDNFTSLYNAFSDQKMDSKVEEGLKLVGDIYENRQFDFTRIPDLIDKFSDKPLGEKERAGLSLVSDLYQNHNFNFAKLPDLIDKFSDKPMDEKTKAGLSLLAQTYQNKGQNFDFTQLPSLINQFSDRKLTDKETAGLNLATSIYKNGNFDFAQLPNLIDQFSDTKLTDKQKAGLNLATSIYKNGNFNYKQLPDLISKFSKKPLKEKDLAALNFAVNAYQGGSFNFAQLPSLINSFSTTKLTAPETAALETMGSVFSGDGVTPQSISKLVTSFDIFKGSKLTDTQKGAYTNLISGTIDMAFSKNFDPVRIASLGFSAAGISNINIDGLGPIPITAILNSYNNPQALLGSIASSLLTNAIVGALGLATGGIAAIFASAIVGSLVSSLLGGILGGGEQNLRYEYYYTACGFYPTYNKAEKIGDTDYKNELSEVNTAYDKALAENTPETWGELVKLKTQYDIVPTEEINEDDVNTQDKKYSDEALSHEQTEEIAKYGLAQVTDEAKTKSDNIVKCMNKEKGGGGVIENGETPEISDSAKKQIAGYKIKVLLGNLIRMGAIAQQEQTDNFFDTIYDNQGGVAKEQIEKNKSLAYNIIKELVKNFPATPVLAADTTNSSKNLINPKYTRILNFNYSQKDLRPTQILTFEPEDVKHFFVLRDKYWGNIYGSPGSQDIILAGNIIREGFGYNKKMWDRIHYGY